MYNGVNKMYSCITAAIKLQIFEGRLIALNRGSLLFAMACYVYSMLYGPPCSTVKSDADFFSAYNRGDLTLRDSYPDTL